VFVVKLLRERMIARDDATPANSRLVRVFLPLAQMGP
jgi:hypothetical protein